MRKRILAALLAAVLIFSLSACNQKETVANEITVSVVNQCDAEIYGVRIEYFVDRQWLGGILASADPDMTKPFDKGDKMYFGVPKLDVQESSSDVPFGMLVYVYLEDERSIPIRFFWEWSAEYDAEYAFEISGTEETGFSLERIGNGFEVQITSWDDLPEDFFE